MGKDKLEHTAKKRVREETELLKRSDAPGNPGDSGTCSRI